MRQITFEDIDRETALCYRIKIYPWQSYYHATSSVYIDRILKEGICRRGVSGTKTIYYGQLKPELAEKEVEDVVFISTYPEVSWADIVCEEYGGEPVFFIVSGRDIINSRCIAYPDYGMLQPVDGRGRVVRYAVKDIMLFGCDCVAVEKHVSFSKIQNV